MDYSAYDLRYSVWVGLFSKGVRPFLWSSRCGCYQRRWGLCFLYRRKIFPVPLLSGLHHFPTPFSLLCLLLCHPTFETRIPCVWNHSHQEQYFDGLAPALLQSHLTTSPNVGRKTEYTHLTFNNITFSDRYKIQMRGTAKHFLYYNTKISKYHGTGS